MQHGAEHASRSTTEEKGILVGQTTGMNNNTTYGYFVVQIQRISTNKS